MGGPRLRVRRAKYQCKEMRMRPSRGNSTLNGTIEVDSQSEDGQTLIAHSPIIISIAEVDKMRPK